MPLGQTSDSYGTGFRFQGGAGKNFNQRASLFLQFDWDGLSVRDDTLAKLLPIYQQACGTLCTGGPIAEVFGSSHVLSVSLNPLITVAGTQHRNAYVVGGVGFYHKTTKFSAPAASASSNGGAQYPTSPGIDRYTSNAAGFNGGFGVSREIARSGAHVYAETRFVFVANSPRPYSTADLKHGFNAFPANSQSTSFVPVTLGIRW